jgi:hypothetical protein
MGLSTNDVRGITVSVDVLALFGAIWALAGLNALPGSSPGAVVGLVIGVFVAFLVAVGLLKRRAEGHVSGGRSIPADVARRRRRGFGIVVALEVALIVVAVVALGATGLTLLIAPVLALIVGVHFLPLARLFGVRVYVATGASIVALALVCIGAIALDLSSGRGVSFAWPVVTNLGSAAILWATALYRVGLGYAHLRHALTT